MSLGENLQNLRAKGRMTQEQLAAELDVSRQTISKWESNQSYPEMDKLNALCDIFGCNLDQLVRGAISTDEATDEFGYDRLMNTVSRQISGGVGLIMLAVALMLFLSGAGLNPLYAVVLMLFIIFAGVIIIIIGGMQQDRFKKKHPRIAVFYPEQVVDDFDRRYIYYIVSGVGLILAGVVVLVLTLGLQQQFNIDSLSDRTVFYATSLFMFILTLGVVPLVYGGMQKEKYDIERYNMMNEPVEGGKSKQERSDNVSGAIMLTATAIFLLLGWLGNLWHIAWVVFPIGGISCAIVDSLVGGRRQRD